MIRLIYHSLGQEYDGREWYYVRKCVISICPDFSNGNCDHIIVGAV